MKKFIKKLIGINDEWLSLNADNQNIEIRRIGFRVTTLEEENKRLKSAIEEVNEAKRQWRIVWSRLRGLQEYLGVEGYKVYIPDLRFMPREEPVIELYKFRKVDKK